MSGRKVKSILTEYMSISAFSQRAAECIHHLVFGSGKRELADKDGLILPLTNDEHNMGQICDRIHGNPAAEKLSKMLGQVAWESCYLAKKLAEVTGDSVSDLMSEAREAFRKRYGQSYL